MKTIVKFILVFFEQIFFLLRYVFLGRIIHTVKLGELVDSISGSETQTGPYSKLPKLVVNTPSESHTVNLRSTQHGNWMELRESLKNGYLPEKHKDGYIKVIKIWRKNKYHVYDGNHRVKLLREMHGNEYNVEVKKNSIFLLPIVTPLILITTFTHKIITNYKKTLTWIGVFTIIWVIILKLIN